MGTNMNTCGRLVYEASIQNGHVVQTYPQQVDVDKINARKTYNELKEFYCIDKYLL